jgi:hypothetical protein
VDELQNLGQAITVKSSKKHVTIRLANGKVFQVTDPLTKPLDPKLKQASMIGAASIIKGIRKAAKEAKQRGVPLSEVLVVS